ncbi:MAG: HAMP domain-containing sensor histidine kinase [Acidimicrobiia bacterium]|nr:HAMP domain-containing sensor histidine kinase [Acidimicrobiia bacterium]
MQPVSTSRALRTHSSSIGRWKGSVLALLLLGAVLTPFLPSDAAAAYATIGVIAGTVTAGTTILAKLPRVPQEERIAWRLFAIGLLLVTGGMLVFLVSYASGYAAAFGPPDLGFLAGYGIGMAGIALLPHTTGSGLQRLRLLLDGIIGAVAVGALAWVLLYSQVAEALTNSPTWERVVGSAYPLFDMTILVVVMIVLIRRSTYRFDPRLVLLAVGWISLAVADMSFLLNGAGRSFDEAEPLFGLTLTAIAAFVLLSVFMDYPLAAREYAERPATPLWALVLPYGTAAVMVGVLVARIRWSGITSADAILMGATVVVATLVLVRQAVAIRENRRLMESQRAILATSISHELRTPLTAMVGFLELLDADSFADDTERAEVTAIVNDQAAYLARIVSDLLMLSSDSDGMELTIAPVPLDRVAWTAVHNASIDQTMVRVDIADNIVAYLDAGRISQALANLLSNAARYGGEHVALCAIVDGGDLVLEVHDDGPGVPRKYELVIWERFERGPNHLNAVAPGSGIGLSVTAAIAKAHGGSAGYRPSDRLGGACFWMRLPGRAQVEPTSRSAADVINIGNHAQSA